MAKRQLRELQRLMAWSWDSRVDEHPPGEKAMHDFENVLSFDLDNNRRRRCTPAGKDATAAAAAAAADDSPAPAAATAAVSAAKQLRRGSADRGVKRNSPSMPSSEAAVAKKMAKAARSDAAAAPSPLAAAPHSPQQQQAGTSTAAAGQAVPASKPGDAAGGKAAAASEQAPTACAARAASPPAAEATPASRQKASPASRQQQPQQQSPAAPPSCLAVTPAAQLPGVTHTPATAEAPFSTALPLSATAAALSDAQFLPTPATAAVPLGGAAALCPPSSCVARSPPRPEEQNASTQVTAEVVAAGKQAVLPRGVLTAMRGKPEAVPAQHAPDVPPAARPVLAVVTGDTPVPALAPLDEQGGAAPQAGIVGPGKVATQQQQQQEEALHGSQPAREEAAAAAAAASGGPPPLSAAAPAASLSGPGGAAESLLALAQLQHNPCATPLAEGAKVPTPILRVFGEAEAEAGDQVPYHQPRPSSCPPLFKRLQAQPGNTADRGEDSPPGSGKLSKALLSGAAGKENSSQCLNAPAAALLGLAPNTAEPAAPPPPGLSGWKQRQLQQLSSGFHGRQRRLLELLSASNRVPQPVVAYGGGTLAAAADSPAPGAFKSSRGTSAAAAPAAKPLGPRAAAVAMARTLGRLKEQQAV
ncbi:hypothetical protein D9Q98_005144 [Chlorella vulgaris]|uniref:Uncharacterized protein n=1 Tax=Chlorella vulgaris TaxID=3077 RepID=A0A9D4TNW4_CHLVU|nr:hypothetical protein D9Q98_005144 [Chlorella vulgaris]